MAAAIHADLRPLFMQIFLRHGLLGLHLINTTTVTTRKGGGKKKCKTKPGSPLKALCGFMKEQGGCLNSTAPGGRVSSSPLVPLLVGLPPVS